MCQHFLALGMYVVLFNHFGTTHFCTRYHSLHNQLYHLWLVLTLVSITLSYRSDEAMLFFMVEACLHYQFISVIQSLEGFYSSYIWI